MPRKISSQQATSQQATAPTGQASRKHKASQIVATVIQLQPTVETAAAFTNNITFDNEVFIRKVIFWSDCKHHGVYGISQLPKECMKTKVEYLLEGDRFICRQSSRDEFRGRFRAEEIVNIIYQWYFQGPKMKGNRDPGFLDRINGVFICFVASAMRHSLKAWKTGDCNPVMQEFKYETAWSQVRMVEVEPVDAPQVEDEARYEAELRKELEHSYERLEVQRRSAVAKGVY
ncbi:hypothetical protein BGX38DRAFT_1263992 [Terfezia claveryi]|nr:hypothetical protein BGX38DRAFT_1263992 [Terfezia claveryi]